ncbi:ATP-binding protein [Nannocystaceae bacterium ST9]
MAEALTDAPANTPVVVVTGAFDCGKTTTLEWLRDRHGLRIHAEAYLSALASLGDRKLGHPADRGFSPIDDPEHFCPMCRPFEFAKLVLAEQAAVERRATSGDLLERGWIDPIEMLLRNVGEDAPRPAWTPVASYVKVIVFAVMPELQRPRWGKSAAQRLAEVVAINQRLEAMYRAAGYEVDVVAPGSVEARATRVLEILTKQV